MRPSVRIVAPLLLLLLAAPTVFADSGEARGDEAAATEEPPPASAAAEAERNLEDWVRGMCPAFTEEKQRAYWNEMRERYRAERSRICALKQTGKELIYAPFTLGVSLLWAGERWNRCLDNQFDWRFQSQIVSGRLEGYRPGDLAEPGEPNAFFVTLHNSGRVAMRDVTLTCDLIGSRLQQVSTSKSFRVEEPLLRGETRTISVPLDPHDRWFCYSMCVYTYTTDY